MHCYLSERDLNKNNFQQFRFDIPVIEGQYVGTGDVFASLLIVWLNKTNGNSKLSVCNVIGSIQALLKKTHELVTKSNLIYFIKILFIKSKTKKNINLF